MNTVMVYGASGHTGRFVVAELRKRGITPILAGRNIDQLDPAARQAAADDPAALDRALAGADAVINCAGPFAVTAAPLIEAALRAGIPYVDVAAEIEANADTFRLFGDRAREAGVPVVPAMAFFGGLADLVLAAAIGDWTSADEVHVAYGLDSWRPTGGTRAAGAVSRQRRNGKRVRYSGGRLEYRDDAAPAEKWLFPEPMGARDMIAEFSMADIITIPSHLDVPEVRSYMTVEAARDLSAPETPAPVGHTDQSFLVDVLVRKDGAERRATVAGTDIYAISAPLAVEAVERILTGRARAVGVVSAGRAFDARDFLTALAPHIEIR
jgi:saccharopine dehydrogenase-like NADP-dependent oxidoreductase